MRRGPSLGLSAEVHATKYRAPGESFEEAMERVATTLGGSGQFKNALLDMRFLPAGRVQAAVGSGRAVTPFNCFVSGTIEDTFVDGTKSIMARATEAAETMRRSGGIGYDFSRLRPRGDTIRSLGSTSSGPLAFMNIYDAVCGCVSSAGHRRGAQMGVLRIDHPDIEEFIEAKTTSGRLTNFNLSIGVTDKFMEALARGGSFDLTFRGQKRRTVDAGELWDKVMRATWDWAEPGVLFIDTINRMNNLWYCETIEATNPCGEQPLPPYGACLLGSFNLVRYVREAPGGWRELNLQQLIEDIFAVVPAMDRVIDVASFPLQAQAHEAREKRRMGLGVTGLANALEACGHPYGSAEFLKKQEYILTLIRDYAYTASAFLAKDRGSSFPAYERSAYTAGAFYATLEPETRKHIARHGIRNSHLTSIAPTGTISLAADNVSSGIEPVFSYGFNRTINMPDGQRVERVEDYGYRVFGVRGKLSSAVTADEHVAVLTTAARLVDSAVSKTCNVSPSMAWEDFKRIYVKAWEGEAKGCTTFNPGGKRMGVLVASEEATEYATCEVDPETGRRSCE